MNKSNSTNKRHTITISVSEEEETLIDLGAQKAGLSRSAYVRKKALSNQGDFIEKTKLMPVLRLLTEHIDKADVTNKKETRNIKERVNDLWGML